MFNVSSFHCLFQANIKHCGRPVTTNIKNYHILWHALKIVVLSILESIKRIEFERYISLQLKLTAINSFSRMSKGIQLSYKPKILILTWSSYKSFTIESEFPLTLTRVSCNQSPENPFFVKRGLLESEVEREGDEAGD